MITKKYKTNKTFRPNVPLKMAALLSLLLALQSRACLDPNQKKLQDSLKKNHVEEKEELKDKQRYQEVTPTEKLLEDAIESGDFEKISAILEAAIESGDFEKISAILEGPIEGKTMGNKKEKCYKIMQMIKALPGRLQQRWKQLTKDKVKNTSLHTVAYSRNKKEFKDLFLIASLSKDQVIDELFALDSNGYSVFAAGYLLLEADVPRAKYIDMFKYILKTVKDFLEPTHFDNILKEMVDIKEKENQIMPESYARNMLGPILASYMDPNKLKEVNLLESHDPNTNRRMKYVAYREKLKKAKSYINKFFSKLVNIINNAKSKISKKDLESTLSTIFENKNKQYKISKEDLESIFKSLNAIFGLGIIDKDAAMQYIKTKIDRKCLHKNDYQEEEEVRDRVEEWAMLYAILDEAKKILEQWSVEELIKNKNRAIDATVELLYTKGHRNYIEDQLKELIGQLCDRCVYDYDEWLHGDEWDK